MDAEPIPEAGAPCQKAGRVADAMTPQPLTVTRDVTAGEVFRMMNERRIRHVPVVDAESELQGLVSRWYLRGRVGLDQPAELAKDLVEAVMTESVDTVSEGTCLAEAARHMLRSKRSSLVVVDEKRRVTGILTEADFLRLAVRGKPACSCEGVHAAE